MKNTLIKSPAASPCMSVVSPSSRERFGVAPIAAAQVSGLSAAGFTAAKAAAYAAVVRDDAQAQLGTAVRTHGNGIPRPRGPQR